MERSIKRSKKLNFWVSSVLPRPHQNPMWPLTTKIKNWNRNTDFACQIYYNIHEIWLIRRNLFYCNSTLHTCLCKNIEWNNSFSSLHIIQQIIHSAICTFSIGKIWFFVHTGHILLPQAKVKPLLYIRYIDDIFELLVREKGEIEEFHELANSIEET